MIGDGPLSVKRWQDVAAIAVLVGMMYSVVQWGLKLDSRLESVTSYIAGDEQRITKIETKMEAGILPVAQARLTEMQRQLDELDSQIHDITNRELAQHKGR